MSIVSDHKASTVQSKSSSTAPNSTTIKETSSKSSEKEVSQLKSASESTSTSEVTRFTELDTDNKFIISSLKSTAPFDTYTHKQLYHLAVNAKKFHCPKNTFITQEGGHGESVFILNSGTAEVLVRKKSLGFIEKGQVFGVKSCLEKIKKTASVRATEDLQFWSISREYFPKLPETISIRSTKFIRPRGDKNLLKTTLEKNFPDLSASETENLLQKSELLVQEEPGVLVGPETDEPGVYTQVFIFLNVIVF